MIIPLSSCYKLDPIRTNSILKFSNGESKKWENTDKNALNSKSVLLWCHKNIFPPPQPRALAQRAVGVSGLGCESGGSAGKTLARFVYRKLRKLLVALRSKSKSRD